MLDAPCEGGHTRAASHSLLWTPDELHYWSNQILVQYELHILKQFGGHALHKKFSVDAYVGLCCVQSVLSEQRIKIILSWVPFFISYIPTIFPLRKEERASYSHMFIKKVTLQWNTVTGTVNLLRTTRICFI